MRIYTLCLLALLAGAGCEQKAPPKLTPEQTALSLLNYDTSMAGYIKRHDDARFEIYTHTGQLVEGHHEDETWAELAGSKGLLLYPAKTSAMALREAIHDTLLKKGYMAIYTTVGDDEAVLVFPTTDQWNALAWRGTEAPNYDITMDSLSHIMRRLDQTYQLTLTGAGLDWCSFTIGKPPANWNKFAKEMLAFCPDLINEHMTSEKDLIASWKESNSIMFWWQ